MSDQITPALTPEEWARYQREATRLGTDVYGAALMLDMQRLTKCHPDAVAALALHHQPFGFTWEMVDALREIARDSEGDSFSRGLNYEAAHAAINNMADLLPPREEA